MTLRIGNASGFYGDRLSAMREMLQGSPRLDVLTGDYLAELTMLILGKDQLKYPALGYARTFSGGLALPILLHFLHNFAVLLIDHALTP